MTKQVRISLLLSLCLLPLQTGAFTAAPIRRARRSTTLRFRDEKTVSPDDSLQTKQPDEVDVKLKQTIETLTKTRPYPLFLAEKTAGTLEGTVKSIVKPLARLTSGDETPTKKIKEDVVVLGVGWGAAALLKDLDTDLYDVTVISPRNHFIFTPMLSESSIGSVEYRSICQPVREINRHAKYIEASATHIDPSTRTISCQSIICEDHQDHCDLPDEFTIEYDRLVVTVGAMTNTFGIPGVEEHCHFLKEISDAKHIRTRLVNCFERASVPGISEEEKRRRLSFVVIGAGPAGLEFAAELRDFIEQDGPKYYCDIFPYISIKLIETTSTVLAPFEKALQDEAVKRISRPAKINCSKARDVLPTDFSILELMLDCPVIKVTVDTIELNDGRVLDHSLAVWAGGIKPLPLTDDLIRSLGPAQEQQQAAARGRIAIDPWLRAYGGDGRIMALGDCAVNPQNPLPPTGQVAAQEGEYLAHLMNEKYDFSPSKAAHGTFLPPVRVPGETLESLQDTIAALSTRHPEFAKPFQYLNLGILAYTGDCSALAQVSTTPKTPNILSTGKLGNFLWRSVYLAKQVSWRNRLLVMNDWLKRVWFGRDISRF